MIKYKHYKKEEIMYEFDDNFYSDIYDAIDYMYTNNNMELTQEQIIGQKLTICRGEQVISNETISQMQDILYNREEERFDENDYLEDKLTKIWNSLKAIKMFYPSTEYYIITEKDMNDYLS